jgi:hypothetical protein
MIYLKYIGLTDEHCLLESRKMLSVGMNRCLQLYHRFKQRTHPVTLYQWECTDVLFFRHVGLTGAYNVSVFEIFASSLCWILIESS